MIWIMKELITKFVHLFVCSPSSNNSILGKAAPDSSNYYTNYAAVAILKNFHWYDLLRSVENEKYAKELTRRIQET